MELGKLIRIVSSLCPCTTKQIRDRTFEMIKSKEVVVLRKVTYKPCIVEQVLLEISKASNVQQLDASFIISLNVGEEIVMKRKEADHRVALAFENLFCSLLPVRALDAIVLSTARANFLQALNDLSSVRIRFSELLEQYPASVFTDAKIPRYFLAPPELVPNNAKSLVDQIVKNLIFKKLISSVVSAVPGGEIKIFR